MPKTRLCKDSTNQPDNDDIFSDFEPPNTTDGSYRGTMKHVKATEAHLQRKFEEKLEEVKTRLKAGNCKVGLKVSGGSIQLQATLPPKPDSGKVKPYQQLISLGIPANLDGLKTAEEEAYELGKLLARKQFEWNEKYLGTKQEEVNVFTVGELLERFEEEYFKKRKKTKKSLRTIKSYIKLIKHRIPLDEYPSDAFFKKILRNIKSETIVYRLYIVLSVFSKIFSLSVDLSEFNKKPASKERLIPTDKEIVNSFNKWELHAMSHRGRCKSEQDNWLFWRWMFGMIAAYGLRPHEVITSPNFQWWLSPENTDNIWKVDNDTKTGSRNVIAINPNWIDLFELKRPDIIHLVTTITDTIDNSTRVNSFVQGLSAWFKRVDVGFQPYDLRHAWAIRAHMLGIPIKAAADNLGHSVEEHTKTYQKWFGMENRKLAFSEAINRKSETELLQEQVQQLKLELEKSKLEVERLKLELQYAKLNN